MKEQIETVKLYTEEHLQLLLSVERATTRLLVYNQLTQSWNEEFQDFMESKIEKAEETLETVTKKLEDYETGNS